VNGDEGVNEGEGVNDVQDVSGVNGKKRGLGGQLAHRLAATRQRPTGRTLTVALTSALALALAVTGYLAVQVHGQHQQELRDQDILSAARQEALNFTSVDYRDFNRDSNNVLSGATGDFKTQFAAQAKQLSSLVTANQSVSQGQVLDAGIVRADGDFARVLVVADSKVTNTAAPAGQVRNYRLQLDLVLTGGRWLTSDVEFVG
jgi:Mce-associated membrane protein